ncbi:hypothetical protein [Halorussus caseinilyticus]|uniref:hypothetical protein n=1 Tax=Halorussus caseinilyticus TaxID=3034025 RepID=UPI0023E7738D|nr:hypothetical protein [Halorussus sp. DT72]
MDSSGPSRRQFLTISGSALSFALAGCSSGGETTDDTTSERTTDDGKTTIDSGGTTTEGNDPTTNETNTTTNTSSSSFIVKVIYDGKWSGSISTIDKSRSIQGGGTKTIEVSGDSSVVSANAQKRDGGANKKLTIKIIQGGEVLKKSSTTAEYGLAQVSSSEFDSGPSGSSPGGSNLSVKVIYDGEWQGSVSADGKIRSVQGAGTKSIDVKGSPSVVSANAQKRDGGANKRLTIKIIQNDEVLKKSSTTAEYGMVQVTATM